MVLLYLHGLNSSAQSHKAQVLREALAPMPVLAPDYPAHRPDAAVATLTAVFRDLAGRGGAPVVVGSSMGGFYGQYLARCFPVSHLFLINPALTPWDLLPDYVGVTMTTARGETYTPTAQMIERTHAYGIAMPCDGDDDGVPTTLFLDRGDEVIDYRIAERLYQGCGRLHIYDGGDHGFQHLDKAIAVIRDVVGKR